MKKVVFSKYNRTRKKEYRLCTCIYEDAFGKKVEKRPLCPEAQAHVLSLRDKSLKMEGVYKNVRMLHPEISGASAVYPYLCGVTADSQLKNFIENSTQLIEELKKMNALLFEAGEGRKVTFESSSAFERIFGKQEFSGAEAVCPANIDMLYDNLMFADGSCYGMDCEWVLEVPVPAKFLEFRSLYYFYVKYRKLLEERWTLEAFLENFAIGADVLPAFLDMEAHFQNYVRGEAFENDERKACEKRVVSGEEIKNVKAYQQRIAELQQEVEERNAHISRLDEQALEQAEVVKGLQAERDRKKKTIREQEGQLAKLSEDIAYLNNLVHVKDGQLAERAQYVGELEAIIAKISRNPMYRVSRIPAKVVKKAFPRGSRRRKILGYIKRSILHPGQICRKLNGTSFNRMYGDIVLGEGYKVHGRVEFPYEAHPEVSIVIPVYNQVNYTYNCLVSILNNTKDVTYEVILADDVSTDATKKIRSFTRNVVVSRNSKNMGFLKNCNQAAAKARGEYILFLNNDTTVGDNWLRPLVELMEKRSDAGMVGSKLVYPDGRLQEAGGIIWKDGTGWNYGREQDPEMPEYNYVKEVDYISGAAVMIRSSLWKEIGGFDERFAPAYYEDTDLAFQVRQRGFKVLYQPHSVVTHYEGVSNGTDLNSGLKKYQVENARKFKEKWAEVLEKYHADGPEQLFLARDQSQNKKVVLFIDHYVPHFDKDAGSKSTFAYVKAFLGQGFSVKFIGDNYFKHEPYTTVLQQMGVEVLYGNWYALNWREWIAQNGKYFDIAFMERPHITIRYIDYFKEHSDARIIYYGHDLHYVREMREYALTHNPETLEHANSMRETEYECMEKSDVVYYPSYVEVEEIAKNNPDIRARAIPVYVYEEPNEVPCMDIHERKDIMFVGGFAHGPNADAVKWFVQEIFPEIQKKHPDIVFYIMGSNPPEEILALNSEHIVVKGFVSDEELDEFYRKCRMAVVPLRYGAGMKGKVIEAMYNKIPLVTTPIGAEGLKEYEDVMCVHEDAASFAECVNGLYENFDVLEQMISAMPEFIEKYFSLRAAMDIIAQDIE